MKITMKKSNELTIEEGFNKFIQKCKVKKLSDRTVGYYEKEYKRFTGFISSDSLLTDVDSEIIDKYVLHLKEETIEKRCRSTIDFTPLKFMLLNILFLCLVVLYMF